MLVDMTGPLYLGRVVSIPKNHVALASRPLLKQGLP